MATGDIIISNNTITPEILATIASEVVDLISTTSKDPGEYEEVTSLTGVSSLPVFQISNNVYRLVRVAMSVLQGTDGREVELQVTDEYIQWRYAGDYWKNLIAIVNLKGDPGETPVFRTSSVSIEWKYESESDESYRELIAIDDLKLNFSDLTDEQKEELKLHFSDLSDEDLDLLKQPATEAAAEVRSDMDKIKEEAESVNQTLTDEIEAIKQEANTLIDETNAAKEAAEVATANAISVSDHPGYIGEDYHVYTWDYTIDSYVKTDTILRPEGFSIYRSYSSIDEMNADLGNVPEGKFVLINTDDVEQEDNAKLYVRGTTAFEYLVDMSGAIGFTGKTPQFSIGTVMDGENVGVSISSDGYDDSANPKYKLNFVIKRGAQGFAPIIESGEISTLEPGEDVSATLQFKENNEDGIPVYTLNISIPKGDKGNIGDTGKTPILSQVEAESGELPSGNFVEDGVDDKGNPQYKLSLILPKGENGLPPVFEKGTITTVDASTNADVEVVENGYTESGNPIFVLNFSIPKGKDGEGQGNVSVIDNTGLVSGVKYLFVPDSTGSTEGKFVEYIEPDIPKKVSELSNDSNFIDNSVSNLLNYYLKSETYSRQEVLDLIGDITTVTFQVVDVRPTTGEGNIIYLVPSDSSEDENVKDEYIYIDGSWELIGTTKIDLTGYLTKTEATSTYQPKGNYLTSVPEEYVTETELTAKGYATTTQVNTKLDSSAYTATDVLSKVKTVDGIDSGLDADLLDGKHGSEYALKTDIVEEAPKDGKQYVRQDGNWSKAEVSGGLENEEVALLLTDLIARDELTLTQDEADKISSICPEVGSFGHAMSNTDVLGNDIGGMISEKYLLWVVQRLDEDSIMAYLNAKYYYFLSSLRYALMIDLPSLTYRNNTGFSYITGDSDGDINTLIIEGQFHNSDGSSYSAGTNLITGGDGNSFLSNSGEYKEIPSQSTFSDTSAIFEQSATYTDFPYQSRIALEGVTANDFVEVVFGINEALSGNYAPICLTENGYVTIYSKVSDTITIPTIIIHR